MAKGAANVEALGGLHSLLAKVFTKTLNKYIAELDALDQIDPDELGEDLLIAMSQIKEPNPAMLSALSKFLKDNDIGMDSDEIEELSSTERRLADQRKRRANSPLNLSVVPHVETG